MIEAVHDPRARARQMFSSALVLAPMTKGSNIPFRRLCRDFGADVTMGEMAIARKVVQRRRGELALLRVHPEDRPFGAQLADRDPDTLAHAAAVAEDMGADFVDLNCGCPIDTFTRRGLGAALLRRPRRLGELVAAMRRAVTIPVTVKLRLGFDETKKNFLELARIAEDAGADAVALHGRTRAQRYSKAADWDAVRALKEAVGIPVIGNGDLLAWWEFQRRIDEGRCDALMAARGALIKPWVFEEVKRRRSIHKTPLERLEVLRRYARYALEHFGDDALGRDRAREFLVWHLGFFCRYRRLDETPWRERSLEHPLLQTRLPDVETDDPLERLMARADEAAHEHLARIALGEIDPDAPAPPPAPRRPPRHAPAG